jgi:hypothetical protein
MLPLESLTIHAFRGLRDVVFDGLGRFNVLVGLNNSGKTSVLEAIATHARPERPSEWLAVVQRREGMFSRAALVEGVRWIFPRPEQRDALAPREVRVSSAGRYPVTETRAVLTEIEDIVDDQAELPGIEADRVRRGVKLELTARGVENQLTLLPTELAPVEILLWETSREPTPRTHPRVSPLPVATLTPYSYRAQRMEVEALSDAILRDQRPRVLDLCRIFDPEIQDVEILKTRGSEPTVYVRHARLGTAPLSSFGEGMRRVLLMGVSLATVHGGVLLIDEIETAIHAEALDRTFRWLMSACREVDVQLFTTTHSLEAVDALLAAGGGAEDLVLHRLDRRDGATRVKRFPSDRLRILRDELGQEVRA